MSKSILFRLVSSSFSRFNSVGIELDTGVGARNGALNGDQIFVGIDADDIEIEDRHPLVSVLSRHLLVFEDSRRRRVRAHGAGLTVNRSHAVRHAKLVAAPSLDNAGIAAALGDARDIHSVAGREGVGRYDIADVHGICVVKLELLQMLFHRHARFREVTFFRFVELSLNNVLKAELNAGITVFLDGFLLRDHAGSGFDDGNRNDVSNFVENLCHTDFLSDDTFFHFFSSL